MSPVSHTVKGSGPCEKRNRPGSGFLPGSGSGLCPGSRSPYQDGGLRLLRTWQVELAGRALKKKGLHGGVAQSSARPRRKAVLCMPRLSHHTVHREWLLWDWEQDRDTRGQVALGTQGFLSSQMKRPR